MAPKDKAPSKAAGKAPTKEPPTKAAPTKPAPTKPKQKALTDAEQPPPKVAKKEDIRDLLGHLSYHAGLKGVKPKNIDPTAQSLLSSYHDASPEEKAAMIEKFKAPNGKKLAWASQFVVKDVETSSDVDKTIENWYTGIEILKMNGVEIAGLADLPPPPHPKEKKNN